jgi:hypothetical protein
LAAIDAKTGNVLWRLYSIPAPGEPGHETWADDHEAWKTGGGAFWYTGAYDPATNLLYYGVGQPTPMFDPEYRPGDNLYTNSTLAINADTGKIVWYFQYTPNEMYDYDEVGSQMIYDVTINGEPRKVLGHFGRNGFYYTLDRTNGSFISAAQYVKNLHWTKGIDPKTGKPVEYDPARKLQQYAVASNRTTGEVDVCPTQGAAAFSRRVEPVEEVGLRRRHRRLRAAHGRRHPHWRPVLERRASRPRQTDGRLHRGHRHDDRQGQGDAPVRLSRLFRRGGDGRRPRLHRDDRRHCSRP